MSYQQQYPSQPTVIYVTTAPATAPPPTVTPTIVYPKSGANKEWRNRPQSKSTMAGGFIFLSGGMNLALSAGWAQYTLFADMKHFYYSWFIGVIIGTIVAEFLRKWLPKKIIMGLSTMLILIGGIMFVSSPYSYDTLVGARYLNGIAQGLAIVTFLVNASEIADNSYRGRCLVVEQYSFSSGIAIRMIYDSYWSMSIDFSANRLHGTFDIVFACFAGIALLYFIESPLDYIRKDEDNAALDILARLRLPIGITLETRNLLEENKAYVCEQNNLTLGESFRMGLIPLIKLLMFRSLLLVFCFSMPLNLSAQISVALNGHTWAPTLAGVCRMLGGFLTLWIVDRLGRKWASAIPVLFIGAILIAVGSIFDDLNNMLDEDKMTTVSSLYVFLQLFVGFFVPYTSIMMGEAFPLKVKPSLMAVCVIVEQILHIIFVDTISTSFGATVIAQGVITVVLFIGLCVAIPETCNTTLTEAQRRYRRLNNLR